MSHPITDLSVAGIAALRGQTYQRAYADVRRGLYGLGIGPSTGWRRYPVARVAEVSGRTFTREQIEAADRAQAPKGTTPPEKRPAARFASMLRTLPQETVVNEIARWLRDRWPKWDERPTVRTLRKLTADPTTTFLDEE